MKTIVSLTLLVGLILFYQNYTFAQHIFVKVIDNETKNQLFNVKITDKNNNKIDYPKKEGLFLLQIDTTKNNVLTFSQQGYETKSVLISSIYKDTLIISLEPKTINLQTVIVSSDKQNKFDEIQSEAYTVKPSEYQKSLGNSLAVSLKNQLGMSLSSMGPATARPIFRGFSGNKISFLANGVNVSDLSSTSPDHSLTINPIAFQRVEIMRGPKLLLYSSNSFGAVVNAQNNQYKIPEKIGISSNLLFESANKGISANIASNVPISDYSIGGNLTYHKSDDLNSGMGTIKNTYNNATDLNLIGLAKFTNFLSNLHYENYRNNYGVPGGFIGAHPNGVDIDIQKNVLIFKSILHFHKPFLDNIEFLMNRNYYHHFEYENKDVVGSEFVFRDYHFKLDFNHINNNILDNGTFSLGFINKDFRIGGYVFTPKTKMNQVNATLYEEFEFTNFALQLSLRTDYANFEPENRAFMNNPSKKRDFSTYSWSLALLKEFNSNLSLGANLSKSSRIPSIEELYSDGPHLAAYSYEIGNSDLKSENGYGLELFGYYQNQNFTLSFAGYSYYYDYYIIPRNTGKINPQQILPIYQTYGVSALISGFETQLESKLSKHIFLKGNIYLTNGQIITSNNYLPAIPPVKSNIEFKYRNNNFLAGTIIELSGAQLKLDEFEEKTDGYIVSNVYVSQMLWISTYLLSINLSVDNLFNTTYRNHLSRIKSIYPEAGRSFKLLLKFSY